jgi:hypothetical protein
MAYIPYENITYKTRLTTNEILQRLLVVVEPKKLFGEATQKTYNGKITSDSFEMMRNLSFSLRDVSFPYTNSFNPVIIGSIQEKSGITNVNVKMRPLIFTSCFMGVIAIFYLVFIAVLLLTTTEAPAFGIFMCIPVSGFFFAIYAFMMWCFRHESEKTLKHLVELFDAAELTNLDEYLLR